MSNRYTIRITIDYDPRIALWCGLCCRDYHCPVAARLYEGDVCVAVVCPDCYDAMKADFDEFRLLIKRRVKRLRKDGRRRNAERIARIYTRMTVPPAVEYELRLGERFLP